MQMLTVCHEQSTESFEDVVNVLNVAQIEALPLTSQQIATAIKKDPVLSQVFHYTVRLAI